MKNKSIIHVYTAMMCTSLQKKKNEEICVCVRRKDIQNNFFSHTLFPVTDHNEIFLFRQTIHFYLVIKDKFSTITDGLNY